jgi:beta-N-acetylhexosaminidase
VPVARDPAVRRRLTALCAVAAVSAIIGMVIGARGSGEGGLDMGAAVRSPDGAQRADFDQAAQLPLERAVGQLLIMSFDGTEAPAYIRRRLRDGEGVGVIMFAKNAPDAGTLRSLTGSLQRAAGGGAIVATDQEGGDIRSVPFAAPEPSQGVLTTPDAAARAAGEGARALRAAGINVNLAPVADVASGPASVVAGRAYGAGAQRVPSLVEAAVRAHDAAGVAATVKHFPGLGSAGANTDDAPVTVSSSREQIEQGDLPPFRAAIGQDVPLVMASHALYPALDTEDIASQSSRVLEDLLRGELGFEGVVVTDSIEAQAVLARSDVAGAAVRSVAAGSDLVLMTGSGSWNEIYPALLERAERDPDFAARVRAAAGRVATLKKRLGLKPAG